ncbi:hypothetical protein [Streptomyces reticuli]|uniref:hypothetical protein n=1 Tax=Streptomyces reticuli TaxID=1926 RepID=UPI00073DBFB4|nr:hypothetical protein [Streptomyces sp. SID7810]CUW31718.1 hypothetical protein TUE45_06467 [Streptomyces reticuli]
MTATDDPQAAIGRLQARVAELEAELVAQQRLNFELQAAAETSRNFRASVSAGYVDLSLDTWPNPAA